MERGLLLLLLVFTMSVVACSYSTNFVVVNESNQTIEVRYKIKRFPNEPLSLTARPAKIAASEIARVTSEHGGI